VCFKSVKPIYLILAQTVSPRKNLFLTYLFAIWTKYEKAQLLRFIQ